MPIHHLQSDLALIVIDFQEGTRKYTGAMGAEAYRAAESLAACFRKRGMPVVLVRMDGGWVGCSDQTPAGRKYSFSPEDMKFVPEVNQQSSDHVVTRSSWSAFQYTDLWNFLSKRGVTQVVICGTAASMGVESTARQATDLGLDVVIALDAITDFRPDALHYVTNAVFPIIAQTGSSSEIIQSL